MIRQLSARALWAVLLGLAVMAAGCGVTEKVVKVYEGYVERRDAGLNKRLCVAPFQGGLEKLADRSQAWRQALVRRLGSGGGVVLVPWEKLARKMAELPPEVRGREERALAAGRELGLNAVLYGQLTDLSLSRKLSGIYGLRENEPFLGLEGELRLVEVATGTVAGQKAFRPEVELSDVVAEGVRLGDAPPAKQVDQLAAELLGQSTEWVNSKLSAMAWAGYVLETAGGRARITVGRDTGLATGSTLVAHGQGEQIRTGEGTEVSLPGPAVARLILTELGARTSWAKIAPPEGQDQPAELTPGLVVRTY
jgi:hypothetical protein